MSDVRQLLDTARGDLPAAPFTIDEITVAGRRGLRRRRLNRSMSLVGAAVAVVVAVVGIPMLRGTPPAEPAATTTGGLPAFTGTITAQTVGAFQVSKTLEVTPGYESAAILRKRGAATVVAGVLTVFRPGVFDPSPYRAGAAVTVGGRGGYLRTITRRAVVVGAHTEGKDPATTRKVELPALAWQYADGAWATITAEMRLVPLMTGTDVTTVAGAVRPAASGPIATLPYKFGYLPDGWRLASAGSRQVTSTGQAGEISRAYLLRSTAFTGLTDRPVLTGGILLSVRPAGQDGSCQDPSVACPGAGGAVSDRIIPGSGYFVAVIDESRTLPPAVIARIAHGLTFADPRDPAGWFPIGR